MKYRFVLIGCGHIGSRHATLMAETGELVALCDVDMKKAVQLREMYGGRAYDNLEELLTHEKEIDIAAICTPNYLHARHSISCLRAGLHVICEKPMAISSLEGKQMLKISLEVNRKLFIVQQNRYNPPVAAVKSLLDEGALGKVHAFQVNCFWNRTAAYYDSPWKGKKLLDGGILFTQFSHFIDILIWLLGEAKSIRASAGNFILGDVIEMEDTGFAIINMRNGAMGTLNYTVTSYLKNMEGSITLFGENGTVKIGGQYLNTLEYYCVENKAAPQIDTSRGSNNYGFYQGSMSNHDIVYDNVLRALNNTGYQLVEAAEALKSVKMIENLYRSTKYR